VFTRTWLRQHAQGMELELLISALRVVTIVVYWLLFRELIRSRPRQSASLRQPLLIGAVALVLAVPFVFRGWSPGGGLGTAIVFALTSVVVGLREELLYRAVLINLVESRTGTVGAVLISTAAFLVYHYGALPIAPLVITEVVSLSLLLGVIYVRSGSLLFVATLHALYDGIWFFGPYLPTPVPDGWRLALLLPALALGIRWATRSNDRKS
jgi:membrane protease YdiL (CAAX protease family)